MERSEKPFSSGEKVPLLCVLLIGVIGLWAWLWALLSERPFELLPFGGARLLLAAISGSAAFFALGMLLGGRWGRRLAVVMILCLSAAVLLPTVLLTVLFCLHPTSDPVVLLTLAVCLIAGSVMLLAVRRFLRAKTAGRVMLGGLAAIAAASLLAGFLLPLIPPTRFVYTQWQFCLNCGALRAVREQGKIGEKTGVQTGELMGETELSKWHVQHFGTGCEHTWQPYDRHFRTHRPVFGYRLPAGFGWAASGFRPYLLELRER